MLNKDNQSLKELLSLICGMLLCVGPNSSLYGLGICALCIHGGTIRERRVPDDEEKVPRSLGF